MLNEPRFTFAENAVSAAVDALTLIGILFAIGVVCIVVGA